MKWIIKYCLFFYLIPISVIASEQIINISNHPSMVEYSIYTISKLMFDEELIAENNFKNFDTKNELLTRMDKMNYENKLSFIKKIDFNKAYIKKPVNLIFFPLLDDLGNLDHLVSNSQFYRNLVPIIELNF